MEFQARQSATTSSLFINFKRLNKHQCNQRMNSTHIKTTENLSSVCELMMETNLVVRQPNNLLTKPLQNGVECFFSHQTGVQLIELDFLTINSLNYTFFFFFFFTENGKLSNSVNFLTAKDVGMSTWTNQNKLKQKQYLTLCPNLNVHLFGYYTPTKH